MGNFIGNQPPPPGRYTGPLNPMASNPWISRLPTAPVTPGGIGMGGGAGATRGSPQAPATGIPQSALGIQSPRIGATKLDGMGHPVQGPTIGGTMKGLGGIGGKTWAPGAIPITGGNGQPQMSFGGPSSWGATQDDGYRIGPGNKTYDGKFHDTFGTGLGQIAAGGPMASMGRDLASGRKQPDKYAPNEEWGKPFADGGLVGEPKIPIISIPVPVPYQYSHNKPVNTTGFIPVDTMYNQGRFLTTPYRYPLLWDQTRQNFERDQAELMRGIPRARAERPKHYSSGGPVGGTGTGDKIRALLDPREFVMKPEAVKRIGVRNLEKLNDGDEPIKMREGGHVAKAKWRRQGIGTDYGSFGPEFSGALDERYIRDSVDPLTNMSRMPSQFDIDRKRRELLHSGDIEALAQFDHLNHATRSGDPGAIADARQRFLEFRAARNYYAGLQQPKMPSIAERGPVVDVEAVDVPQGAQGISAMLQQAGAQALNPPQYRPTADSLNGPLQAGELRRISSPYGSGYSIGVEKPSVPATITPAAARIK